MRACLLLLPLLIAIVARVLQAEIIHVPDDSTTIQGGINGAVNGDTVMVHPGTYYEHDIDFFGKAITVMGTNPKDSSVVASTVVNADSLGRVFHFHSGEDSTSILAGLTLTEGFEGVGSGIGFGSSSPTIMYNIITGNSAEYNGGGIGCLDSAGFSTPKIINNVITGNAADNGGGIGFLQGIGKMDISNRSAPSEGSSPTIINNTITENMAIESGGGICCYRSDMIIRNNVIEGNTAASGGGISCVSSSPMVSNNIVEGNSADIFGGGFASSGINGTNPTITNNIFIGNSSQYGGGMNFERSEGIITNNVITGNSAEYGGGIHEGTYGYLIVTNTILWANDALLGNEISLGMPGDSLHSIMDISYSDVQGGQDSVHIIEDGVLIWGEGMIDNDPLFITFKGFEYLLHPLSPCMDAGDPSKEDSLYDWHPKWPDWYPNSSRSDMGAYGGPGNIGWLKY
jgi:parallel beta-helix repeat protein